jgi:serine protease DegQ
MAAGQESDTRFACQMGLWFRDLAGQKCIGTGGDGVFKIALCTTRAPGNAAQAPAIASHHHGRAAGLLLRRLHEVLQVHVGRADEAKRLLTKPRIRQQAQAVAKLRVVAQLGMGVQRQVVGKQIDIGQHQTPHARGQPARQAAVVATPKETVVHQQRVGTGSDGRVDKSQTGRDTRDDVLHRPRALHLQTIRPIIFESLRLQQGLQALFNFFTFSHAADSAQSQQLKSMWRRTWLVFSQAVTVAVAALFVLLTLKPQWLPGAASARSEAAAAAPLPIPTLLQAPAPLVPLNNEAGSGYALAARRAAPAVVSVTATKMSRRNPHLDDPRRLPFFGGDAAAPGAQQIGLGSGVIVSPEGYLLTNHHVVADATEIEVQLADGRQTSAKLVGSDVETDIAVLKITLDKLPVIALGDVRALQVGDAVLAIGNPFNVGQTVTAGIVSALDRKQNDSPFQNFIQTDAAINPGNSGGALVDAQGALVGINTAIFSRSGGNLGIGFAVPADTARAVMQALVQGGSVRRGWIGVVPRDLSAELAQSLNLPVQSGVLITGVVQDGPAARGGVQPGDVVTKIGNKAVHNTGELLSAVAALAPNSAASLGLQRGAKILEVRVQVAERQKPRSVSAPR